MAPDEKELTQAIIASIEEMREDAEWKGRISTMVEMTMKSVTELTAKQVKSEETLFAKLDEVKCRLDSKVNEMNELMTSLRVKVAGWSALFGSLATIFLYFIMKFVFKA